MREQTSAVHRALDEHEARGGSLRNLGRRVKPLAYGDRMRRALTERILSMATPMHGVSVGCATVLGFLRALEKEAARVMIPLLDNYTEYEITARHIRAKYTVLSALPTNPDELLPCQTIHSTALYFDRERHHLADYAGAKVDIIVLRAGTIMLACAILPLKAGAYSLWSDEPQSEQLTRYDALETRANTLEKECQRLRRLSKKAKRDANYWCEAWREVHVALQCTAKTEHDVPGIQPTASPCL